MSTSWSEVRQLLTGKPNDELLEIIKGLYNLSPDNKAYLRAYFSGDHEDPELLGKYRRDIERAIYPNNRFPPGYPRFSDSRKAIRAYQKATGDIRGTIDLMLTQIERGVEYAHDIGDIDERFYNTMVTMLDNAMDLLLKNPHAPQLYVQFSERLERLVQETQSIGWGYGDDVKQMVTDVKKYCLIED